MQSTVSQVMTKDCQFLSPEQPMAVAFELMLNQNLDWVLVIDRVGKPAGILMQSDFLRWQVNCAPEKVGEWMTLAFNPLTEDMPVDKAWKLPGKIFPVCDLSGRVTGVVSKTDLWRAYCEQVEYNLKELDAILNSAHNGIIAVDEQGIITTINPSAERLTGCTSKEVLGSYLPDVMITTDLLEVVKTGQTQDSQKCQVGRRRKFISNRTPIVMDGKIKGAVAVFQDIFELESYSQELCSVKELNEELQTVIDSSYDGILVTDSQGKVLRFNDAFLRITGLTSNQVGGRTMENLVADGILSVSIVEMVKIQGTVTTLEKATPSGNCLMVTGNPILNSDGDIVRIVINVRNITELNKLRQELEQAREQTERYQCELAKLRTQVINKAGVVASSPQMVKMLELAWRVAQVNTTVMILGESGTGKEVIAEFIHNNSLRADGPLIKINCGAIPENLLESELFGYEAGAFTGANKSGKPGMFELANGGTLFLDEIGDLPFNLQVKLLRILQDPEMVRLGGVKSRQIDVRILVATNQDLEKKVSSGGFREDLFFRLNVVPIVIPPLRERREDIIPLIHFFQAKFHEKYKIEKQLSPETMDVLVNYDWPGNVREVENIIERLLVTVPGDWISLEHLPSRMQSNAICAEAIVSVKKIIPLKKAVMELERQLIVRAMDRYKSTYKAAEALNVNQSTLFRKMQKINNNSVPIVPGKEA